jgi:mono/diheme cytochrome c family protein
MKFLVYSTVVILALSLVACGPKREQNDVYMPDMAYSRTVESNSFGPEHAAKLEKDGIYFNARPVQGTVRQGDTTGWYVAEDKLGDTINYAASAAIINPLPALPASEVAEVERQYLIYCGICHGSKLDGNGVLYVTGKLAGQPANLSGGNAKYVTMKDGQMYYSITYGKNSMGAYASQVTKDMRWKMIQYIRMKQQANIKPAATVITNTNTKAGTP